MAYLMTVEDMIQDIQQYLDTDPRYWSEDEGVVSFGDEKVHYVRLPDEFQLTIEGSKVFVPRF